MAQTISTAMHAGVRLDARHAEPVIVTGAGAIDTRGAYAIYGSWAAAWFIDNDGTLSAGGFGVTMAGDGTVVNGAAALAAASIEGARAGIAMRGGSDLVRNDGRILAFGVGGYGVGVLGGTVVNGADAARATIEGEGVGVLTQARPARVLNDGTIAAIGQGRGNAGIGVDLWAGGTLINGREAARARITGPGFGVLTRDAALLVNDGTIASAGTAAVYMLGGNTLLNGAANGAGYGGLIDGASIGVQMIGSVQGANTLTNLGTIIGTQTSGVYLEAGGTVVNGGTGDVSARMVGGINGLEVKGWGSVVNYGTIIGTDPPPKGLVFPPPVFPVPPHAPWGGYGVNLQWGGSLRNGAEGDRAATIYGKFMGLQVHGGTGLVNNYGTISGGMVGVYTWRAGLVVNGSESDRTAFISGADFGLFNSYPGETVLNYARIDSASGSGVDLPSGGHAPAAGTLVNGSLTDTVATISGGKNGVTTVNGAYVLNYGTMLGRAGIGAYVTAGGGLVNGSARDTGALIEGHLIGAAVKGGFSNGTGTPVITNTLVNDGTIIGQGGGAALVSFGGVLTNGAPDVTGALIEAGTGPGVAATGTSRIVNDGTIASASGYGASLNGAATLSNGTPGLTSARISGTTGVGIFAARGVVANDGGIFGVQTATLGAQDGAGLASGLSSALGSGLAGGDGVLLVAGGLVENGLGADDDAGIRATRAGVGGRRLITVVNAGTIVAGSVGVYALSGGTVVNGSLSDQGARIAGGMGVLIQAGGTVSNGGIIVGNDGYGVLLAAGGGIVVNGGGGAHAATIASASVGIISRGGRLQLDNHAGVSGGVGGVSMVMGGTVVNAGGATIAGNAWGVAASGQGGPSTVMNAGTIGAGAGGAGYAVSLGGGGYVANGIAHGRSGYLGALLSGGVAIGGAPGTVVNQATILALASGAAGVALRRGGEVANAGTIRGGREAVYLRAGGSVANGAASAADAWLSGGAYGVLVRGAAAVIGNDGTVSGGRYGILARVGASVVNGASDATGAVIAGGAFGLDVQAASGRLVNFGTVTGASGVGVFLAAGGTVVNGGGAGGGARIAGGQVGVAASGLPGATRLLVNDGTVTGALGVDFSAGSARATIVNRGTIIGTAGTAIRLGGGADRLVIDPGSAILGRVDGGGGGSVLELSAGGAGTLGGADSQFAGFSALQVDAGASWSLGGDTVIATLRDDGVLSIEAGGRLEALAGIDPASAGVVALQGSAAFAVGALGDGGAIRFQGGGAELVVDHGASAAGGSGATLLEDFGAGDAVDLAGLRLGAVAALQFQTGSGVLAVLGAGGTLASLRFDPASLGAGRFHVSDDGGGHALIGIG